jgi:hypothetical protein
MRRFYCSCGKPIYFENTRCLGCNLELGFVPDQQMVVSLAGPSGSAYETRLGEYRKCGNYVDLGVCNWMIPSASADTLCRACQLNRVIPDLSQPENQQRWAEVERAKRRLLYTLLRLNLPWTSKAEDPESGLAFDIKADVGQEHVLTGHSDGLITLNVIEADPAERERLRVALHERYRTLLGHFRHEVGHYYWDRLVRDGSQLEPFRSLFGDERTDYATALRTHYAAGTKHDSGPDANFISAYAGAHPWEDFAESFAHYLHLEDTLETAHHFGFTSHLPTRSSIVDVPSFDPLIAEWNELVIVLNELNRSMGLPDAYPFAISPKVRAKLAFVHALVKNAGDTSSGRVARPQLVRNAQVPNNALRTAE